MYHGNPRVWRPMMKITSRQLRTRQPIGEQSAGREGELPATPQSCLARGYQRLFLRAFGTRSFHVSADSLKGGEKECTTFTVSTGNAPHGEIVESLQCKAAGETMVNTTGKKIPVGLGLSMTVIVVHAKRFKSLF